MKLLIHLLLLIISGGLITIGVIDSEKVPAILNSISTEIGTTFFVALTVAKIFEHFSLREIDKKFEFWNKKAALANLSTYLGTEIPEEHAESLFKVVKPGALQRTDFEDCYDFSEDGQGNVCHLTSMVTVRNSTQKAVRYVFRHEFHRGFFPDYGDSLEFRELKVVQMERNHVVESLATRTGCESEKAIHFERAYSVPARSSYRFISSVKFRVTDTFSFFDSFFQPVCGVKIRLRHNYENALMGFSGAKFWQERFVEEQSDARSLSLKFSGIVFPGQGVGIWMHRQRMER